MKLKNAVLLMILPSLLASANSLFAQQWAVTSAPVTNWSSLATSADGSNLVATIDQGGIYFSPDSGVTWQPSDAPNAYWTGIACSADGSIAAAVTGDGKAYRSWDSGATWVASYVPTHFGYFFCVAGSADGGEFAAGSWFEDIFLSTNSGAAWFGTGAPNTSWDGIAMSADGRRLAAVCNNMGPIYVSTDSGATWRPTSATNANWNCVSCSADGLTIAAAGNNMYTGIGSIYVSTDGGNTWVRTQAPNEDWSSIAVSADGARMIAGAGGNYQWAQAIYISKNFGATWSAAGGPELPWTAVAISADGTKLAAAAHGSGIYVSQLPQATAWELINDALIEMTAAFKISRYHRPQLGIAINSVRASLVNAFWMDQSHLVPKGSQGFFIDEKTAVFNLDLLSHLKGNPVPKSLVTDWESQLVNADRLLARAECDAVVGTASPALLAKIQKALDQGDQAAMRQEYYVAVRDYVAAYQWAMAGNAHP